MPVLVTGAAGFIGSALVGELARHGHPVVALDRRPMLALPPGAQPLTADLLDPDPAVEAALREAAAIFHLAGRPGVRDADPEADRYRYRDNVLATARVLAHARPAVPLVLVSSSAVYGGSRSRPSAEHHPLRPLGGYARSKVAMEGLAAARLAAGGAVAVARPFTVVGERQRPDMTLALWATAIRRGDPVLIHGSPYRSRDVIDVRHTARALRLMAERGVTGPLNIGTGRPRTLAELAAAVATAAAASTAVIVVPAWCADPPDTCADTRLLERRLGFRPQTDLADVARRVVATERMGAEPAVPPDPPGPPDWLVPPDRVVAVAAPDQVAAPGRGSA